MTGYILYGYPQSGSAAIEVALAVGGIPHEVRDLDPEAGDLAGPDFLALNPRGQVPVLVLPDGSVVTEIPAILLHLADAHPESGLAPAPGSAARAQHDRWLAFAHANLYEGVLRSFYADRYTTDPHGADGVRAAAQAYVRRHLALLEMAMVGEPFLLGPRLMGVDCLIWVILSWLGPEDKADALRLSALADAVATDPHAKTVAARHS
ncbi:glutathione S-transferase family protein [Palleronia sp. KMU-117]|uniref:glutathione S-transferase family protein n=1 Tax=Palleronia sp. KMU-117 TaxID=3434108 RepID=UPI003D71542E